MKRVIYQDKTGRLHCSLLRDTDDESKARLGIPIDPPPVGEILKSIEQDLHNELVRRGLFTWEDVQDQQTGLSAAIRGIVIKAFIEFYRSKALTKEENKNG